MISTCFLIRMFLRSQNLPNKAHNNHPRHSTLAYHHPDHLLSVSKDKAVRANGLGHRQYAGRRSGRADREPDRVPSQRDTACIVYYRRFGQRGNLRNMCLQSGHKTETYT